MGSGLFIFGSMINLVLLGFLIYAFVLFIKLANRGIKAFDIYINEKSKNNEQNY